jgi:uncharacterized YigZ family protein
MFIFAHFMEFYNTISQAGTAEFKDRGSRFLAFAYPVNNAAEFKTYLQGLKKEHAKAVHHCFAYRLGLDLNNYRSSDDGEPSGTAGKPILGQLDSKQLTDTAVIVVRYFGGTLLGVPGLINAYKTSASLVLQVVPIIQKPVYTSFDLEYDYTLMNDVMLVVKQLQCNVESQQAVLFCTMKVGVPVAKKEEFLYRIKNLPNVVIR